MTLDGGMLRDFCRLIGNRAVVLVDEAYIELTDKPEYTSVVDLVSEEQNVVVMRTFSKIFGMAGLRVGYGMARARSRPNDRRPRDGLAERCRSGGGPGQLYRRRIHQPLQGEDFRGARDGQRDIPKKWHRAAAIPDQFRLRGHWAKCNQISTADGSAETYLSAAASSTTRTTCALAWESSRNLKCSIASLMNSTRHQHKRLSGRAGSDDRDQQIRQGTSQCRIAESDRIADCAIRFFDGCLRHRI